jgi:LmbE family N-acetylglucosaminyl deacetylase
MHKTLLAIGAHYDDCPFGIPGVLLNAVRRHHRVVILNLIGDYSHWAPVRGRADALRELSVRLAAERGIEMRFLDYASMQFEANYAPRGGRSGGRREARRGLHPVGSRPPPGP